MTTLPPRTAHKAGRRPATYYWPSRLKHRIEDCRRETGGLGANWEPLEGPFSFVEQFFVMRWALRLIAPRQYANDQQLSIDVFAVVSEGGTKQFGPPLVRGAHRTPGVGRPRHDQQDVTALLRAARGQSTAFEESQLRDALEAATKLVDRVVLDVTGRRISSRAILKRRGTSPTQALRALLGEAGEPVPRFLSEKIIGLSRSAAFREAAELPEGHDLCAIADSALAELKRSDGARVVVLQGSPFSGRTIACRYILDKIESEDDGELALEDRSGLPVIAVSLDDLEPSRCVDDVLRFFRRAAYVSTKAVDNLPTDDAAKLRELQKIARLPVFFMLAGSRKIGSNPIVSATTPNLIAGLVDIILRSHADTRVLVTADTEGSLEGRAIYRGVSAVKLHVIPIEDAVYTRNPILPMYRDDVVLRTILSWRSNGKPLALSGLTLAIAYTVGTRLRQLQTKTSAAGNRLHPDLRHVYISWQHSTYANNPFALLDLLWRTDLVLNGERQGLLNNQQKMLLGTIAASHDGLQLSTLLKLLRAMRDHKSLVWDKGSSPRTLIDDILDPDKLVAVLEGMRDIVGCRISPKLDERGRLVDGETEKHYWLFNWRRRSILALWCDTRPQDARNAIWMIAREAAQRALTLNDFSRHGLQATGRSMHALSALLGSIDFAEKARTKAKDGAQRNLPENETGRILPDVRVDRAKTKAREVFEFAWRGLYVRQLGSGQLFLPSLFADSEVRFATLMSFLHVGQPWLDFMEETLDDRLTSYATQVSLVGPTSMAELLTQLARSALRLCRFDVVVAAKRLGEQLCAQFSSARLPRHLLVDLLCTEIEASIMSGHCLDSPVLPVPRLATEAARSRHDLRLIRDYIDGVIDKYAPRPTKMQPDSPENRRARAMLLSRQGEVLSLMGLVPRACRVFEEARAIEDELSANETDDRLLGRSTRRHARALIRDARKKAWRKAQTLRCNAQYPHSRKVPPLRLPHPGIVEDRKVFTRVRELIAKNKQYAENVKGPGIAAEFVGVNVLRACLASLRHDNVEAFRILQNATKHTLSPAIGVELYVDLWGVRAQIMIDSALLLLADKNAIRGFSPKRAAVEFGGLLGAAQVLDPPAAARELLKGAQQTIDAMRDFSARDMQRLRVDAMRDFGPHGLEPLRIFSDYLSACARALASQLLTDPDRAQEEIEAAARDFASVIIDMSRTGYRLFEQEAKKWRDLLVAALDPSRMSFAVGPPSSEPLQIVGDPDSTSSSSQADGAQSEGEPRRAYQPSHESSQPAAVVAASGTRPTES